MANKLLFNADIYYVDLPFGFIGVIGLPPID